MARSLQSWLSAKEIAEMALPSLPSAERALLNRISREGWEKRKDAKGQPLWRKREGRGGGKEWHVSILPQAAQSALLNRSFEGIESAKIKHDLEVQKAECRLDSLTFKARQIALYRLEIVQSVEEQARQLGKALAVSKVAIDVGVSPSTIWNWLNSITGVPVQARLGVLAPKEKGKPMKIEISQDALKFFCDNYLLPSKPTFEDCWRNLLKVAKKQFWECGTLKTLIRRYRELTPRYREVLLREGEEALSRMYPAQERDRSHFSALQCVCADGHKWDLMVEFEDGTIGRPITLAFQDLYSNKIVSYRHAQSESAHLVALAIHDLVRDYGVPDECYLDNGRGFASKWITGQTPNRYRFKVKPTDPPGLLNQLGVNVHWAKPYSGQSKPIERGWRDFASSIAKHPAFANCYTGPSVANKPHNYGDIVPVPYKVWEKIVNDGIKEHNAREGRRTRVCRGIYSFDQVFEESFATRLVAKPSPAQLRMFLMEAEEVSVRKQDNSIWLKGNRFWHEALAEHYGKKLHVRFDPDHIHQDLAVYAQTGELICLAECIDAVGFDSTEDAKTHEKARRAFIRAQKEMARIEQKYSADDLAAALADDGDNIDEISPTPRPAATRLMTNLAIAPERRALPDDEEFLDFFAKQTAPTRHLRIVE